MTILTEEATMGNYVIGSARATIDGKETYLSRCIPINPQPTCQGCIRQDRRLPPLLEYDANKCLGEGPCLYIRGDDIQFAE
jgi:hypothetical protein